MTEYPVFSLNAVLRKDLASYTKVLSIDDMEYYLWVKVEPEIAQNYALYEFDEIDGEKKDINLNDICSHDPGRIWYKFNSILLNRNPGQHVYRMHMVNQENETTISLYFSYILQRADIEKPYIYMPGPVEDLKRRKLH